MLHVGPQQSDKGSDSDVGLYLGDSDAGLYLGDSDAGLYLGDSDAGRQGRTGTEPAVQVAVLPCLGGHVRACVGCASAPLRDHLRPPLGEQVAVLPWSPLAPKQRGSGGDGPLRDKQASLHSGPPLCSG